MNYDEFIGHVRRNARMGSSEEAVRSVRATLSTLAETLPNTKAERLASHLPEEIGAYIREARPQQACRGSVREFVRKISDRENVELTDSVYHARVVFEAIRQSVPPRHFREVISQLPEDFNGLFTSGPAERPAQAR